MICGVTIATLLESAYNAVVASVQVAAPPDHHRRRLLVAVLHLRRAAVLRRLQVEGLRRHLVLRRGAIGEWL